MQNAMKLENISNLITSPSSYQCRKTTVNMKVSDYSITNCDVRLSKICHE
jgi:hypothetical protein